MIGDKRYAGWRFWWYVFLVSMGLGVFFVLTYNATVDLSPQKTEQWKVVYNGHRPLKYLNPLDSRLNHGTNEQILVLTRHGKQLIYTYTPDSLSSYLTNMTKGTLVKVNFQMGGMGFYRIYFIWKN